MFDFRTIFDRLTLEFGYRLWGEGSDRFLMILCGQVADGFDEENRVKIAMS